jgi:Ser-tRNA(Ala) deacylase AlaX
MNTELLALQNTYNYSCNAIVGEIGVFNEVPFVILNQTVFYPQGGGQPSDTGRIFIQEKIFEVSKCQIIEDKCYHFGSFSSDQFSVGDVVDVEIDAEKRNLHARLHTAGHVIDLGLAKLGYELEPLKGYHFVAGPYVEYVDSLPNDSDLIVRLESALDDIIATDAKTSFELVAGTHENGKPMRVMHIEGFPDCGCGGTHVEHLGQIGRIKIRKIKGNRVAYEVL